MFVKTREAGEGRKGGSMYCSEKSGDNEISEKIYGEEYVDLIGETFINPELSVPFRDYCVIELNDNASLIYVNKQEVKTLFPSAEMYSIVPRIYSFVGESERGILDYTKYDAVALQQLNVAQTQSGPLSLTGKGTVWAMIGPGIDYKNPIFRKENGDTRILAIWDQTIQGDAPEKYGYGMVFTGEEINQALRQNISLVEVKSTKALQNTDITSMQERTEEPEREVGAARVSAGNFMEYVPDHVDENGFGSELAALAVGNAHDGKVRSPAPDTELVIVKLKQAKDYLKELYCISPDSSAYSEADIMTALDYVRSFVSVTRRGVAVLCPLGSSLGNHGGSSALDRFLSDLTSIRNIAVVWCSGDEGNERHHYEGIFPAWDSTNQNVEIDVPEGRGNFMMQFWAEEPGAFELSLRNPLGETTGILTERNHNWKNYDFVYGQGKVTVSYLLTETLSGWQMAVFRFEDPLPGVWSLQVSDINQGIPSRYHIWLPLEAWNERGVTFLVSSPYTTMTSPILSRGFLPISGYDNRTKGFAVQNSRGYAANGMIYPCLSAPGFQITTIKGVRGSSSLAASLASGCVSQILQWGITDGNDVTIDGNEIKNYLIRGADRKEELIYPNREWGYGEINISATFLRIAGIIQ